MDRDVWEKDNFSNNIAANNIPTPKPTKKKHNGQTSHSNLFIAKMCYQKSFI